MAGRLPERARCEAHPFNHIGQDGLCVLCEGERLARRDFDRRGKPKKAKFTFNQLKQNKKSKFVPWDDSGETEEEKLDPSSTDEVLATIRSMG